MEKNNIQATTKSSEQSFEELYGKKEYKAAIDKLLQNKQHFSSGIFHYNMGTTYAKLNDLGPARFHLEKAIKSGIYNSAVLNNLNYVQSKLEVDDLSASVQITDQVMNWSLKFPHEAYLSLSLLFAILFLIFTKLKKVRSKILLSLFSFIAIMPILYSYVFLSEFNYAIALKDISIMEGPSKIFQEKGKLKAGSKVILGDFKDGWFFVKNPISLSGWVSKDQLGIY